MEYDPGPDPHLSVFVFALSENSLRSAACLAELQYARELGRPILPIQIGDLPGLRDHIVFSYQSIDYRRPTASAGIALIRAVQQRERETPPLPDPLPVPPAIPYEYLMLLGTSIQGRTPLSPAEQDSILGQLRQALHDEHDEAVLRDVRTLLATLATRPEATHVTVTEIEALLAQRVGPVGPVAPVDQPVQVPVPGWYPDPAGGPQRRYWDGARWAHPTTPAQPGPVRPLTGDHKGSVAKVVRWIAVGLLLLLFLIFVLG